MGSTLALTRAELMRLTRNKRYFIFTVLLPVILYLLLARQFTGKVYGVSFGAFYMVDMAMLGAFSGALNGNAIRISQEKRKAGSGSSGSPRCRPTPTWSARSSSRWRPPWPPS